jgi:hypothetical protein
MRVVLDGWKGARSPHAFDPRERANEGVVAAKPRTTPVVSPYPLLNETFFRGYDPASEPHVTSIMAFPVIIRTQKLSSIQSVRRSGKHTWREQETLNADPDRGKNEDLHAVRSSAALAEAVLARVALATEKAAEKPVLAIEYLITARYEAFREGGGTVDAEAYFRDAMTWLEARHGKENIVAANIQRDETTQHLVVYAVPLVETEAKTRKRSVIVGTNEDGTKRRETREYPQPATVRLSAAHFQGSPGALSALQTDFAVAVGARHGLARGVKGSKAEHKTLRQWYGELGTLADDPRLKPMPHAKLTPLPPEPSALDRMRGRGPEMDKARAEALAKRQQQEKSNAKAREHNAQREALLQRLAGQGIERRNAEAVRQQQAQETKAAQADAAKARAEFAALRNLAKDKLAEKDRHIEHWKSQTETQNTQAEQLYQTSLQAQQERDTARAEAEYLLHELRQHAPERARELGLEEPQRRQDSPGMRM